MSLVINLPIFAQSSVGIAPLESAAYVQAIERYRAGDYMEAIAQFESVLNNSSNITPKTQANLEEKLARSYHLAGYGEEAVEYWDKVINYYFATENQEKITKLLIEKAQSYLILGRAREAIAILCVAETENSKLIVNRNQQNSSQPTKFDCQAKTVLGNSITNAKIEVAAVGTYAEALRLVGGEQNYQQAIHLLLSLIDTNLITSPAQDTSIRLSLGKIYTNQALIYQRRASYAEEQGDTQKVKDFETTALGYTLKAQESFRYLNNDYFKNFSGKQIQAELDLINLYNLSDENQKIEALLPSLLNKLSQLPDSQKKAFWLIEAATLSKKANAFHLSPTPKEKCDRFFETEISENLLAQATNVGKKYDDVRIQSFAQGELGGLYECQASQISVNNKLLENKSLAQQKIKLLKQALTFTNEAQKLAAQNIENQDSLYLWQWQAARIYRELQKPELEKQAYENAISTLTAIRSELISGNKESRFNFRDNIEPIYRNFAETLLSETKKLGKERQELGQTLGIVNQTLDELRLAELQNYFGNDCNLAYFEEDDINKLVDDKTAVIRTIISSENTYIVATFTEDQKSSYSLGINSSQLKIKIRAFKGAVSDRNNRHISQFKRNSKSLYDILFPNTLVQELESRNIETLVFLHDGLLQSIPMAALFDGEHYLIEKYAIAMTPSLQVTVPKSLEKARNRPALLAGLITKSSGSQYLPFAQEEIDAINSTFNRQSVTIPNAKQAFNIANIASELSRQSYSVVHIVTHGKFTFEPASSYILTEDSQDPKLAIPELEKIIRQSSTDSSRIDLLTLSGCETAVGDQRSTLGLAGIAIQAGVNSAIASLWQVADGSSNSLLMAEFYKYYLQGEPKAKALQHAQIELIRSDRKFARPYYWSPFVLIGNWL